MKHFFYIVSILVVASFVAGCCACRKGKNNMPLKGTEWHLMRLMGRDLSVDADKFLFTFSEDGEFGGTGACNRIFGAFKSNDQRAISFENLASTRMMCPDANLEAQFVEVLDRATHYEVDGNVLMILSNGEVQAILMAK
jgi:heat shock protein HslJ